MFDEARVYLGAGQVDKMAERKPTDWDPIPPDPPGLDNSSANVTVERHGDKHFTFRGGGRTHASFHSQAASKMS